MNYEMYLFYPKYTRFAYHHCVHVHPVELEVLGLAQVLELCFGWRRAAVNEKRMAVYLHFIILFY